MGFADDEDGPFAAVTCGVVLAIFENGSFWGGPDIAEPFFARRRAMTMDAHRLVEAIERIERAGGTGRLDSERFGAYGEQLQRLLDKREDERLPLRELSALKKQAEGDLAEMLKHLRPVDRRMIREDQR